MANEKLEALLSDEKFFKGIVDIEMEAVEKMKKAFSDKGVTLEGEELIGIRSAISAKFGPKGKLDEAQLDEVVGGKLGPKAKKALLATLGVLGVAGAAGAAVGGYIGIKRLKDKKAGAATEAEVQTEAPEQAQAQANRRATTGGLGYDPGPRG